MNEELKIFRRLFMDDEKPFYKSRKGILAIICGCFLCFTLIGSIGSVFSPENNILVEEKIYFGDKSTCKVSAQVTNITRLVVESKELNLNQLTINDDDTNVDEAIDTASQGENTCADLYLEDSEEREKYVSITINRVNSQGSLVPLENNLNNFDSFPT